jgi:MoaA/NifB/PqqE/SkfB family radical SAM enzyme
VITQKISFKELMQGSWKFLLMKSGKTLFGVNLEVTRRCNLSCDSCDFWREKGEENRLDDYAPIIRHLNPLQLSITGGEPLLRKDLDKIIDSIRSNTTFVYMNLITNGWLLTVDRALSLWRAGLNQLTVSLDFPDERHGVHRGASELWPHLKELLPKLANTEIDNLCLNTVIMKENAENLIDIAKLAKAWGYKVSFSTYNPHKSNNPDHLISKDQLFRLDHTIDTLIQWKRRHRNINNSDFYLKQVSRYFREGSVSGCMAGRKWVQVIPDGRVRRCSDKEILGDGLDFKPRRIPMTACTNCWYACRGESEAPLGIKRIIELNR